MSAPLVRAAQGGIDRLWSLAWRLRHGGVKAANTTRSMSIEDLAEAIRGALGGAASSGITVTPRAALQSAAYWTAVKVLAETVAQIPFNVMRPTDDGRGAEIAADAPLQRLIAKRGRPNEIQTSYQFKHMMVWRIVTRGNFYAFKNFAGETLRELLPVRPSTRVTPEIDDDYRLTYRVQLPRGGERRFTRAQVFHAMGPSEDLDQGLNPLNYVSEAVGLAIAQDRHAGKLFANGARLWGVLEHPSTLSPEAAKRIEESFRETYAGPENAHKTPVLEEGMTFEAVAQKAEEAQLLESRKLQRSIVAAQDRVPPHMVGDLDKATFTNIENLARQFIDYGIVPWLENIETAMDHQLLSEAERAAGLYVKAKPAALLRGDSLSQARVFQILRSIEVMSANEIRELLDLNPREGGDDFTNPNINPREAAADGADEPGQARNDGRGRAPLSIIEGGEGR